ncbi:hypothetical protein SAMN06295912_11721 [Sphingomonas laterariae]|uniref:Uncharacterized protein n=1 Tax=Edaphosphingomonas laterariae TaxID=861865 RepID=A0A239HHM4_9SPHN|nr:hypothetical protein [Sphingomonas laterariae]SNS80645.1 hypothetical protein SAMN06295912_11721 [Sphingomonas laterariae]
MPAKAGIGARPGSDLTQIKAAIRGPVYPASGLVQEVAMTGLVDNWFNYVVLAEVLLFMGVLGYVSIADALAGR